MERIHHIRNVLNNHPVRIIEPGGFKGSVTIHQDVNLKDGKGDVSTESGVLAHTQYSFGTRFENGIGTNPEELIAAAHAGCFSMALSGQLASAGLVADKIDTTATVTFDKLEQGWTVTESHLQVNATVPGATEESFAKLAHDAKVGCPISRLLNTTITLDAKLTI